MSRIRADRVTDRAGTGPVEITYGANITGVTTAAHLNVTGICTATSFEGSGANLTGLPEGTNVLKAMLFS
jgi:hypothetical protein